jgi:branched-chain amino acid transport system ATP-binding protein
MKPLLSVNALTKRFGALVVTDAVDLAVGSSEVHALIGPNGAGKSTLLAQIAGEIRPESGAVFFDDADITGLPSHRRARLRIGRTFQINSSFRSFTVRENVMLAVLAARAVKPWALKPWALFDRDRELHARADRILEEVGLADRRDALALSLPHGALRQLEIALAIAAEARLLLLDEPLAGIAAGEAAAMISLLQRLRARCALLLVEHDMDAVFALADRVTVLAEGRVIASGVPSSVALDENVRRVYLGGAA